jgi:hypothetical protein
MITTINLTNPTHRSPARSALLLTAAILVCFALPVIPKALGISPPPDGGYAGANTAEGDNALFSLTNGVNNTADGANALFSNTAGNSNTATGFDALLLNTTGSSNTATGVDALFSNTTGSSNTATGLGVLFSNTTGNNNTATGFDALESNTTGGENTAVGFEALFRNTTGNFNTAAGGGALLNNTTGSDNTATGINALANNTTGPFNTATGFAALQGNTTGSGNTASGIAALLNNTTGSSNTATGSNALANNTTGPSNTATGVGALVSNTTGSNNTAEGVSALNRNTTGSFNIALGNSAGINLTKGNNNIDIGSAGLAGESAKIRIGTKGTQKQTFIAGISGVTVAGGVGVIVNSNGQLGTVTSSARFKEQIKPMEKASEAILKLEPVSFRYKHDLDPAGIPQFGLVAEQVEKVAPELVARDEQGKAYTVRYEAVNAMLLNEFLKEHRKAEEQGCRQKEEEAAIHVLKSIVARQQKEINALTTSLRTVSDELERSKVAPELVADNH